MVAAPENLPAVDRAPPGSVPLRELALPTLVVLAVVVLIAALLPLAISFSAPRWVAIPYWSLIGYLVACCAALATALWQGGGRPFPLAQSRREASLLLAGGMAAGGYLVGLVVYQLLQLPPLQTAVGSTAQDASALGGFATASLLGMLFCYLALGGVSLGLTLHLWLRRRQLPLAVARFAAGGAAVAAVLAGLALLRQQEAFRSGAAPLLLFALGALLTSPLGLLIGARVLPHGRAALAPARA